MLGSLICPIVWTLAIRQVVRQPLPRVIPEKAYSEVPHRYVWSYYSTPSIHSLLASFCNLLLYIGSAFFGFLSQRILVFFFNDTATTEIYTLSLHDALPISFNEMAALLEDGTHDWRGVE